MGRDSESLAEIAKALEKLYAVGCVSRCSQFGQAGDRWQFENELQQGDRLTGRGTPFTRMETAKTHKCQLSTRHHPIYGMRISRRQLTLLISADARGEIAVPGLW